MTLPPRCQHQIDTARHSPYAIQICPRDALPGSKWCALHDIPELGAHIRVTRRHEMNGSITFTGRLARIGVIGFTLDTDPPDARRLTLSFVPPWHYTQTIEAAGESLSPERTP